MANSTPEWVPLPSSVVRRERILITVKAYPNPSQKYIEAVCIAGVTRANQWIRLYPVSYRFLDYDQQFRTYAWIDADVSKSKDHRPESHYIDVDSIQVVGNIDTARKWEERKKLLLPLVSPSIEYLQGQNDKERTSLGLIRPKEVRQLIIKKQAPEWSDKEKAKLLQRSLLDGVEADGTYKAIQELEKVPYRFRYEFFCNDARCTGHTYSIESWEVLQSYRKWRELYGDTGWEAKFRQRYEEEFLSDRCDLHFYFGTILRHPKTWTIIGLFYPPASPHTQSVIQTSLF